MPTFTELDKANGVPFVDTHREVLLHDYTTYPIETRNTNTGVTYEDAPNPYPASSSFMGVGRDSLHHGDRKEAPVESLSIPEWTTVRGGWPYTLAPHAIQPVVIPFGDRVSAVPIGQVPEIIAPRARGFMGILKANPTHEADVSFVGATDPFAKVS